MKVEIRVVQILCNSSAARLNFVLWLLIFMGRKCGNSCFEVVLRFFENVSTFGFDIALNKVTTASFHIIIQVQVQQSRYRPGVAQRVPGS